MKRRICLIYNFAQHYRTAIFQLMDKELDCSFYFGDEMEDLKKMDYNLLNNFKKELRNISLVKPIYWQKGAVSLFFKDYEKYIILGEYYCISTWVLLILCKFSKKKTFLWTHGWYGNEGILKKLVKKIFFNLGDGILLYGNYAKELMIKEGFKREKMNVIYNSLNHKLQLKIRQETKKTDVFSDYFKNNDPVLIFVGRLTKAKKLKQLIQACQQLLERGINTNLVFVGEGSVKNELIEELLKIEKSKYWFYGECYEEKKIAELIHNAVVCVSPGNVGLTAMHSLVYGTPVITHNNFSNQMPEFEAIIPDKTGDFFIEDNINDLSKVIEKWIVKSHERKEIQNDCYDIIDKYYNPNFQLRVIKDVIN